MSMENEVGMMGNGDMEAGAQKQRTMREMPNGSMVALTDEEYTKEMQAYNDEQEN